MKTAPEYVAYVRKHNPEIFGCWNHTLQLSAESLEAELVKAFKAGHEAGVEAGRGEKSVFEQIFGKRR